MDVDEIEEEVDSVGRGPKQGGLGKGFQGGGGSGTGKYNAAAAARTLSGMPKGVCANCWQPDHWKNECPYLP